MAFQPLLYPDGWTGLVKEALARAHYQCELCHVRRGDERRNLKTDEKYLVYLSVCHRVFYYTWKHDADTLVLCQRCHNRFDAKFRKRIKLKVETPIGYAKVYVPQGNKSVLVSMCRTYIELLLVIDVFQPGQEFCIHLEINSKIVGIGRYLRTQSGVEVLEEDGVTEGFSLAFTVIPESVTPLPALACVT